LTLHPSYEWFKRFVSSTRSSFALALSLSAMILAYRIQLTFGLFTSSVRPFDFNPGTHPARFMLIYLPYDLALILACFWIAWPLSRMPGYFRNKLTSSILKIAGFIFLHLVILSLLIIHATHIRLFFDAQTGLDTAMIREVWLNIPLGELFKFIHLKEALLLLLPLGIFWLVLLLPFSLRLWMVRLSILLLVLLSSIWAFAAHDRKNLIPSEIRLNPALFLLSDVTDRAFVRYSAQQEALNIQTNDQAIRLAGPEYSHSIKPSKWLPVRDTRPWNIIFFIMESVGTRYAFDPGLGQSMPMPFLYQMSKEGWHLRNHYTTSNISNKAAFSLLSGLYDFFNRETFGIRVDAHLPSLYHFLAGSHDSFLVTPSPITWYFPTAFVKNSGLSELHTYDNLNLSIKEEYHSLGHYIGREETQTVDFFIRRLKKAKEPFLGIYFSFAAHFPYFDYGPDYRVREDDGRAINRYYNNLNLLDHMIRRIYDNLKETGLLERTILVMVGDHGQAFGQHHPDNFMHYRYSYNENLEAPAILYQPALFKPKVFDIATSHVDLLPTLLDAIRVPYDPALFDGESLFQSQLKRKYLFFYGYEESISCLDTQKIKVQYSLKKNKCWAYDLKTDPEEKRPLDCSAFQPQLDALLNFVRHHDSSLMKYNASFGIQKDFQGHSHPTLFNKGKGNVVQRAGLPDSLSRVRNEQDP
jgi:membrane-anchored protein YejM (alkaline phosphatase superfamily)